LNYIRRLLDDASLKTVLSGRSVVDYPNMNFENIDECNAFLECYGYHALDDAEEVEAIRQEALVLLRSVILNNNVKLPKRLVEVTDMTQFLFWASSTKKSAIALWSCSLLRIMHTLVHCHSFFNEHYHRSIREQIISKIQSHIVRNETGIFLGDIKLSDFQTRPLKTRQSVAIKLLHKAENISADIFDWIGVRFITSYRFDALRVLTYLRKKNIIMFANVKPSRSRNSLCDVSWLKKRWDEGDLNDIRDSFEDSEFPKSDGIPAANIHSNSNYRSIQFTCRQRIKINQNNFQPLRFFFPFEVQITDRKSYLENKMGESSHIAYKKRQLIAVRKRVLGVLYDKYGSIEE